MDAKPSFPAGLDSGMTTIITPEMVLPSGVEGLPPDAPMVAVVVSLNVPGATEEVAGLVRRFTSVALQELTDLGTRVLLVDSSDPNRPDPSIVDKANGALFLGGGDVDSTIYGHTGTVPREWGVDRENDEFSLTAIKRTIDRDAPLFCICRGSQLLNVALGGSLIPDIENFHPHRGGEGDAMFKDETVLVEPGSKVGALLGRDTVTVRSGHHQAVGRLGDGLVVTARAEDGIVEGTELPDARWVVGLQWHPEDDDGSAADRRLLFSGFVEEVRRASIGD